MFVIGSGDMRRRYFLATSGGTADTIDTQMHEPPAEIQTLDLATYNVTFCSSTKRRKMLLYLDYGRESNSRKHHRRTQHCIMSVEDSAMEGRCASIYHHTNTHIVE